MWQDAAAINKQQPSMAYLGRFAPKLCVCGCVGVGNIYYMEMGPQTFSKSFNNRKSAL